MSSVVVFDTIDKVYSMLYEKIAEENGVVDVGQVPHGAGWAMANRRMSAMLEDVYREFGVILISHTRLIQVAYGGIEANKVVPDLSDSPRKVITGWVDGIIYLEMKEVQKTEDDDEQGQQFQRVAICQPSPYVEAGGRGPFRFMPREVSLGDSPEDGFNNLREAFEEASAENLKEQQKKQTTNGKRRKK